MATFTNQATLSYNGNVTSSNTVTGEIVQVLTVTKTSLSAGYAAGDTITYVISLTNAGSIPYSGIVLRDDLGAYTFGGSTLVPLSYAGDMLYYINGILQATPEVAPGPPLSVGPLTVPAGSDALLIYKAELNSFAPPGSDGSIENTVTITGPGIVNPVTASETVTSLTEPRLTINKAISPSQVVENGTVTYTFTIENTGSTPATADANIVVSDLFDPVLDSIRVSVDSVERSSPEFYSYSESTGQFSTVAGEITVPAATYTQDPVTGVWSVIPGRTVLTVSGTV